jgi:hypothetical protein
MVAHEAVELEKLLVGEAEIGFSDGTSSSPEGPSRQTPNV